MVTMMMTRDKEQARDKVGNDEEDERDDGADDNDNISSRNSLVLGWLKKPAPKEAVTLVSGVDELIDLLHKEAKVL